MLSKCLISIVVVLFVAFTSKADPVVVIGEGHTLRREVVSSLICEILITPSQRT